jgi:hypothetical protein
MREARVMAKLDSLKERITDDIAIAAEQGNDKAMRVLTGLMTEIKQVEQEESTDGNQKAP